MNILLERYKKYNPKRRNIHGAMSSISAKLNSYGTAFKTYRNRRKICTSKGYKPGTDQYKQCMRNLLEN